MATIESKLAPLELSTDDGTTWKELVCIESVDMPTERAVTETVTYCGRQIGLAPMTFNPSGQAVCDPSYDDDTQISYKDLLAKQKAGDSLLFRISHGASGASFYLSGSCKVTSLQLTGSATDVIKFSFTLTGEGELDITSA